MAAEVDLAECTNCPKLGRCCWLRVELPLAKGTQSVYSRIRCPFLSKENGLCTVYERRLDVAPWCHEASYPGVLWPSFCPHTDKSRTAPIDANQFFNERGKSEEKREAFLDMVDDLVIQGIFKQFGVKLTKESEIAP